MYTSVSFLTIRNLLIRFVWRKKEKKQSDICVRGYICAVLWLERFDRCLRRPSSEHTIEKENVRRLEIDDDMSKQSLTRRTVLVLMRMKKKRFSSSSSLLFILFQEQGLFEKDTVEHKY